MTPEEKQELRESMLEMAGVLTFDSKEKYHEWYNTFCPALDAIPKDCTYKQVIDELIRIEHGILS